MIDITPSEATPLRPRICVIGVGGAGANAVETMIAAGVEGVDFIVANTDAQALNGSRADKRIQLGRLATEGLGAGSDPAVGTLAAQEAIADVGRALDGAHMCFIAAGMGGGTGTGAASIIAAAANAKGILTVGVVTLPFTFEGARRARIAEDGLTELEKHVDTLIVIPNQNLFRVTRAETTFKEAFNLADTVLQQGVQGITDLIVKPGLVNLDFADIRTIMGGMGRAMMASGEASGPNRAVAAADMAIFNPLLQGQMKGARGLIISISGGEDLRLMEMDEAAGHIRDLAHPEAEIIWGSAVDAALEGRMRISIVATGLEVDERQVEALSAEAAVLRTPYLEELRVQPGVLDRKQAPFVGTGAAAVIEGVEPKRRQKAQASPDDLLAMFMPEGCEPLSRDPITPIVPGDAPTAGAGLFQRMATLAHGAAKPDREVQPPARELEPSGPAFYNRRSAGGRR